MKKLLLLAAAGYALYTLGKRAGNRNPAADGNTQNAMDDTMVLRSDGDAADALLGIAAFDERQVTLAELALARTVGNETRSLATLLLEEHNANLDRVRTLGEAVGVTLDTSSDSFDDATVVRLQAADAGEFESQWLSAVTDEHSRMLESIDDLWLPHTNDERIAEHLRLVRDDVHMHLQNAIAMGGTQRDADAA